MSERRERIRASLRASQDATRERMARRRERLSRKADRETQARLAEVKRAKTLEERVCRDLPPWAPSDTCWEWQGFRDEDGYGRFQWQGKKIRAHRAAYMVFVGPVTEGAVVRHNCDNPPCCHPGHLEIGTQADNVRDREERGRGVRPADRSGPGMDRGAK